MNTVGVSYLRSVLVGPTSKVYHRPFQGRVWCGSIDPRSAVSLFERGAFLGGLRPCRRCFGVRRNSLLLEREFPGSPR